MDVRTSKGDSCLIIALRNGYEYQDLIEYTLQMIWKANGLKCSPLIFDNILKSKYNNYGDTILDVLIECKLSSVLNYVIQQNHVSKVSFLSQNDRTRINDVMGIRNIHHDQ